VEVLGTWTTENEAETFRLGGTLLAWLPADAVVSVEGTLGAGKSVLVRGLANELGIDANEVTSPTFTLWQTYEGTQTLHHLDAYRLDSVAEFQDLGVEELFEQSGFVVVEWGDKVRGALPVDHFQVELEITGPVSRLVTLRGRTHVRSH